MINEQNAEHKPSNSMRSSLHGWGFFFIIGGVISNFVPEILDPTWGRLLIILGVIINLIPKRGMFILIGSVLMIVGLLNFSLIEGFGWFKIIAILQMILGYSQFKNYSKYGSTQSKTDYSKAEKKYQLALHYENQAFDYSKAIEIYNEILEEYPNTDYAKDAKINIKIIQKKIGNEHKDETGLIWCVNCNTRVLPKTGDVCPNCGSNLLNKHKSEVVKEEIIYDINDIEFKIVDSYDEIKKMSIDRVVLLISHTAWRWAGGDSFSKDFKNKITPQLCKIAKCNNIVICWSNIGPKSNLRTYLKNIEKAKRGYFIFKNESLITWKLDNNIYLKNSDEIIKDINELLQALN